MNDMIADASTMSFAPEADRVRVGPLEERQIGEHFGRQVVLEADVDRDRRLHLERLELAEAAEGRACTRWRISAYDACGVIVIAE